MINNKNKNKQGYRLRYGLRVCGGNATCYRPSKGPREKPLGSYSVYFTVSRIKLPSEIQTRLTAATASLRSLRVGGRDEWVYV